ncbi:MAG: hypothetical protein U5K74_07900 [Gemmatimonadaceae bacterium]|nr:hypothetical protein [Gemmatimonadaceae bacterium]
MPKVLITADGGFRRGQIVPLKRNADKAQCRTRPASSTAWWCSVAPAP